MKNGNVLVATEIVANSFKTYHKKLLTLQCLFKLAYVFIKILLFIFLNNQKDKGTHLSLRKWLENSLNCFCFL